MNLVEPNTTPRSPKFMIYLPLTMLLVLFFVSYTLSNSEFVTDSITIDQVLSNEGEYSFYFNISLLLIVLSIADFFLLSRVIEESIQSKNITLIPIVMTELPLVFGFILVYITKNLELFYPFVIIFFIFYLYMYKKISHLS